ncbi:hypothetical protein L7F22_024551 [Adiantum nelumboides]|nr:hypothetical protein [Adiantum nelumboides]
MGNFGDTKCEKSNGAGIKEESNRSCATTLEEKDCKPASVEHKLKGASGKGAQGNVQKRLSSNKSPPRLVLDTVEEGIELLASVAACEVLETGKSFSGSTVAEVQPVSADGLRDSPIEAMADSQHQKCHHNGNKGIEGAQAASENGISSNQEIELPETSLTKGLLMTAEDQIPGDGVLIVGTQSAPLASFAMKQGSPASVLGVEGGFCEGEKVASATVRDLNDSASLVNPIGTLSTGQLQTESESSSISVDEGRKDAESVPQGCVSGKDTKDLDSLGSYGEDALEVARQVAKEVEQEVEKYCVTEVQDAKIASNSSDLPTSESAHTGSIRIFSGDTDRHTDVGQASMSAETLPESIVVTEKGRCQLGRVSDRDEVPLQHHDQNTVRQFDEPARDSMTAFKEASESSETVPVATAEEECAGANVNLKSSCAEKVPSDGTCEMKDVERPVFDLNEGLAIDESTATTVPISSPIPGIFCSEPLAGLAAQASSLAAPVAVVAATKGAFIPPSNPSRTKGELGWKGSAATSAFRPAEPRRVAETSQPSCEASAATRASIEATSQGGKQPRILDIDLNIADERVLEDSGPIARPPGVSVNESLTDGAVRPDLDLNRVDGSFEHLIPSLLISRGTAVSTSRGSVIASRAPCVMLDFDLNDGLGFEEEAPSQHRNHESSSVLVAGGSRQNTDIPNVPPWYSASNTTTAAMMMSTFPTSSRSESSYPVVAPASKSATNTGHSFGAFSNDIYRGAGVSSSTVPYAGSIPGSFSYPGFPFGAGFPLASASYNMGSPLNTSASSPPFLASTPSQLVSAGAVVSPYGRPFMMGSVRDIPGLDSSASWVRPNLDLSTGPEITVDFDTRDHSRPSLGLSQLSYQQATSLGGSLKRKEPEGSFDPFRSGFKQTAWR